MEINTFHEVVLIGIPQLIALIMAFILTLYYSKKHQIVATAIAVICTIVMLFLLANTGFGWTVTTTDIVPIEYAFEEDVDWTGSVL